MNTLDTTHETSNSWSPYKVETKQFLEDAKRETFESVVQCLINGIYNSTKLYVLYGCNVSISGMTYTITPGAIFCKDAYALANNLPGEIYTVPAASVTLSGGNVVVANLQKTPDPTADPTIFSDNVSQNIHIIRQIVFAAGASGSGSVTGDVNSDLSNIVRRNYLINIADDTQMSTPPSSGGFVLLATSTPTNFEFTTPDDGVTRTWRIDFKSHYTVGNGGNSHASSLLRMYNVTDSVRLDYMETHLEPADAGKINEGSVYLTSGIVSLGPNKHIQMQITGIGTDDGVLYDYTKFIATEITN